MNPYKQDVGYVYEFHILIMKYSLMLHNITNEPVFT